MRSHAVPTSIGMGAPPVMTRFNLFPSWEWTSRKSRRRRGNGNTAASVVALARVLVLPSAAAIRSTRSSKRLSSCGTARMVVI